MQIIHHGAQIGVTGSCHELVLDAGESLLVDCGMFQGNDAKRRKAEYAHKMCPNGVCDIDNDQIYMRIDFPISQIQALLVTHVHIDHIGRIPYLLDAGFRKPIYCTVPTAELLPIMLEDAIQLGITRKKHIVSQYLRDLKKLIRPIEYGEWFEPTASTKARFTQAGHVLGSAYIDIDHGDKRVVFSGDLGSHDAPLLNSPDSPERADCLVLESTYGDRLHEGRENRMNRLKEILERTIENSGVTIIPAFALGRTQELLYEMNYILEDIGKTSQSTSLSNVAFVVDSPLAVKLSAAYNHLRDYWGSEAKKVLDVDSQPLIFENLIEIDDTKDHVKLVETLKKNRKAAIFIAGSGMVTGGRVIDLMMNFVGRETTDILFVGYQAEGTPGRWLVEGHNYVNLQKRRFDVRAKIHSISGYSAHADQADLIKFVTGMQQKPKNIRLVHGDLRAKEVLKQKLIEQGYDVTLSDDLEASSLPL
jgi:metallo-beta-lactamase family protein